jgi:ElaB/YqjD/DUF883 family membrane-anchored ribosome-binding protein
MPTNNPTQSAPPASASAFGTTQQQQKIADRVEQTTQHAADAAVAQVREVRERAESGLAEQRSLVAERVRRLGGVLRTGSDQLTREDEFVQSLLDTASERVERVADYIDRASPSDVIEDLSTLARTQPGLFFGGAFVLGLAIGRFAKSSQRESYGSTPSRTYYREPAEGASRMQVESTGATASGVAYSAPTSNEKKPQEREASEQARPVSPGEGNKS